MKNKLILVLLVIILVTLTLFVACKPATTTGAKTLKIGLISWLGWPNGLAMKDGIEIMVEMDNKSGGLNIGGEKYNIQLIAYDSNNTQATAVAAANKLIYEDKVKFILTDGFFMSAWLPTADENKVISGGWAPDFKATLSPDVKYHYDSCFFDTIQVALTGWLCNKYPDKAKSIVIAYPDNQQGHMNADTDAVGWAVLGAAPPTAVFYPAESQDLSALGTKVKSLNPSIFSAVGGGPISDGLALKAAYQAGYRGQLFASGTQPALSLTQLISPEALEGFISGAFPVEFDPPKTKASKEFKEAWIAKYGKWEGPEIILVAQYAGLRAALQQAKSLDTDKVASVLFNGMKFEGPTGDGQMIPRLDLGNSRTVDSVATMYIKQIKGGQPTLLDTIDAADGLKYFQKAFPAAK